MPSTSSQPIRGLLVVEGLVTLLLALVWVAHADTATHQLADQTRQRQVWAGDLVPGYLTAGCLPVTSATTTLAAFACEGYVRDSTTDELLYVAQGAHAVGPLSGGSGVYWVGLRRDTQLTPAGWTSQAGTRYVWRLSASQPAPASGVLLIASATVAGGAVTAVGDYRLPASYARTGRFDITDPLYGAVGDGVTDNAAALEQALNAYPPGAVVEVPVGVFLLSRNVWVCRDNVTLQGRGFGSILRAAAGFANTGNSGLVEFGVGIGAVACASVTNVTVRDLTLDGLSLAKALGVRNLTQGLISHIQALNGGPNGGALYTNDTTDLVIEYNVVNGAIGVFGDGIYIGGGVRTRVVGNTIDTFTRIGIVTESGGAGAKSVDVYIAGNTMRGGHNATAPERNAGYYGENTCGVTLVGNTVANMTNTPGAVTSVGMRFSIAGGGQCQWHAYGNEVSGAQRGLDISVDVSDTVVVDGYRVGRGTLAEYTDGIVIQSGNDITLKGITLGSNNWSLGRGINVSASTAIKSLTIADSTTDPTATALATTAALHVFSMVSTIGSLTLRNLQGFDVLMYVAPTNVYVSDSTLLHRTTSVGATSYMFQAAQLLSIVNSRIQRANGSSRQMVRAINGSVFQTSNTLWDNVDMVLDNGAAGTTMWVTFTGCRMTLAPQIEFSGAFYALFADNVWTDSPATGAIRANGRALPMTLIVSNNSFTTTDVTWTPVVRFSNDPTGILLQGNLHSTTLLTSSTLAVLQGAQGRLFANLGTLGNGSVLFCSDCAIANPCAGAGTGAIAKRLAAAWVCN